MPTIYSNTSHGVLWDGPIPEGHFWLNVDASDNAIQEHIDQCVDAKIEAAEELDEDTVGFWRDKEWERLCCDPDTWNSLLEWIDDFETAIDAAEQCGEGAPRWDHDAEQWEWPQWIIDNGFEEYAEDYYTELAAYNRGPAGSSIALSRWDQNFLAWRGRRIATEAYHEHWHGFREKYGAEAPLADKYNSDYAAGNYDAAQCAEVPYSERRACQTLARSELYDEVRSRVIEAKVSHYNYEQDISACKYRNLTGHYPKIAEVA